MIIISDKSSGSTIYVPKHWATTSSLTLTLKSRLTNDEYPYAVEDLSALTDYFVVEIDTTDLPDGELEYRMTEENEIVSSGLLRVGEYKADKTEYNYTQEYIEYQND